MNEFFSMENRLWSLVKKIIDLVWLNFLCILCSLPLITAGASLTALFHVCFKLQKNQEGYLTSDFYQAFRSNFKQGTLLWLIFSGCGLVLGADLFLYLTSTSASLLHWGLMAAFFACFALYLMEIIYAFALQAKFENTVKNTLKNGLLMAVTHLPASILMLCIPVLLAFIAFLLFPPLFLLGVSGTVFIDCWFLERIFKQYSQ